MQGEQEENASPGGRGVPLFGPAAAPVSPSETGVGLLNFIVHELPLIICNHLPPTVGPSAFGHLRWGHPPSAGPRQKKGAEVAWVQHLEVAGRGRWFPTLFAMKLRKGWGTQAWGRE